MDPDPSCLKEALADQCGEGNLCKREGEALSQQAAPVASSAGKTGPTGGHLGRLRAWGDTGLQPSHFNPMFLFSSPIVYKCAHLPCGEMEYQISELFEN